MQLSELNLNRFLYRDVQNLSPDTSATQIYNAENISSSSSSSTPPPPVPGSVITSVILQSSNSDDRIEISPDDTLKAYNNGNVVLQIDRNGIVANNGTFTNLVATNASVTTGTVATLSVTTKFFYKGISMPVIYTGVVTLAGPGALLPAGWSSALVATGQYRITHNLNVGGPVTSSVFAFVAPISGHFRSRIPIYTANYFEVWWQQTNYVNRTFNVVGGGGGVVTVQGVRDTAAPEVPVNVAFTFIAIQNLQ